MSIGLLSHFTRLICVVYSDLDIENVIWNRFFSRVFATIYVHSDFLKYFFISADGVLCMLYKTVHRYFSLVLLSVVLIECKWHQGLNSVATLTFFLKYLYVLTSFKLTGNFIFKIISSHAVIKRNFRTNRYNTRRRTSLLSLESYNRETSHRTMAI